MRITVTTDGTAASTVVFDEALNPSLPTVVEKLELRYVARDAKGATLERVVFIGPTDFVEATNSYVGERNRELRNGDLVSPACGSVTVVESERAGTFKVGCAKVLGTCGEEHACCYVDPDSGRPVFRSWPVYKQEGSR